MQPFTIQSCDGTRRVFVQRGTRNEIHRIGRRWTAMVGGTSDQPERSLGAFTTMRDAAQALQAVRP